MSRTLYIYIYNINFGPLSNMKKNRLLVVLLRTNALARKPAQKLKLTHQSANRFRRPYQVDYIASLQAHSIRRLKPIHQLNRLTGGTGNTQLNQSLVKTGSRSITENRAFDMNSIPPKRAFRGMAGLAVLYPSVVDYID